MYSLHSTPSESIILSKIFYQGWTPINTDSEEASATRGLAHPLTFPLSPLRPDRRDALSYLVAASSLDALQKRAARRILARVFGVALESGQAMESKPPQPESTFHSTQRGRFSRLQVIGFVSAIVLLAIIVVLVITTMSTSKVVWLTPAQLARSTQPGPFATFKQKVRNLMGPVWRRFRRAPSQIVISSSLLTLSSTTSEQFGLAAPTTTNANGMRAWILGATESSALQQRLKTNSAASLSGSPGIATFNGFSSRVVVGSAAPTVGVPGAVMTIDLIPRVVSGSVKLTVAAASIEGVGPSRNAPSAKTNFTATCQAVIPSGGSLVLDGGSPKEGGENRYWLIISPRVWIPTGK